MDSPSASVLAFIAALTFSGASPLVDDPFIVPEGLEVTLWAESPLFFNPTNIDIDARGRIWVTEGVNYRDFNNKPDLQHAGGDRIVILEDVDGDGRADSSTVFVQDEELRSPLGIAVMGNRVVVSSSPNLFVYTDLDKDDRADSRDVLLTGFGGYDHDHGLHAVVAGPDGRWYFNAGNAGPHVVTDRAGWTLRSGSLYVGGTPYNTENHGGMVSDDGRVWVGGLALRVNPDGTGLTVLGHNFRNAFELTVDSFGNVWQNDNDDEVAACRMTYLMEGGNAGFFSADGTRTWQGDRRPGQEVFTAHWHQDDPGVIPAGERTGAGAPAGATIYEGDALGPEYRGMLLSADAGRNVVFGFRTVPDGAGYRMERFNFMTSVSESTEGYVWNALDDDRRKWFRPSDVAVGPDGAIYVADWYDPIVGGHQMKDSRGHGRIYRIAPSGKSLSAPAIDLETVAGQLEALRSPAPSVRATGFERLRASGTSASVAPLLSSENPFVRARALWLLSAMGERSRVEDALQDPDSQMRITAFRVLRSAGVNVLLYADELSRDTSAAVRREVALALRDIPFEYSSPILLELARRYESGDRWYLEALGTAAAGHEEAFYELLQEDPGTSDPFAWSPAFADIVWRLHPVTAVEALQARAASSDLDSEQRIRARTALAFIPDARAARAMEALADAGDAEAAWWIEYRSTNEWSGFGIRSVHRRGEPQPADHLLRLSKALLDPESLIDQRLESAWKLVPDSRGALTLLALLIDGKLSYQIRQSIRGEMLRHSDPVVRALSRKVFDFRPVVPEASAGDVSHGEPLFLSKCSVCHRRGSIGSDVGPDLTDISGKLDVAGLYEAMADPDASVAHGYVPTIILTRDGSAVAGFVLADGEMLTIRTLLGQRENVVAAEVETRVVMPGSAMPAAGALGLSEQDVADIVAFLGAHR